MDQQFKSRKVYVASQVQFPNLQLYLTLYHLDEGVQTSMTLVSG